MMPLDIMFFLQQRQREIRQRAEQARLLRAMRRTPGSSEQVFQRLTWWLGSTLVSWGCSLQAVSRAVPLAEKGCCVCLP
jgi:hypothetical protein